MKTKNQLLFLFVVLIPYLSYGQNEIDLLILNKNYKEAILSINHKLENQPSANLYLKKGRVLQNLQNYQEALQAFYTGLQYEPENIQLIEQSAECFAILGNNADAVLYYKQAASLDTTNLAVAAKLGRVHINRKEFKEAYKVFDGIYQKDSSNVYWNKQFAYCSFRMFNRKQACYLYEKVLEANPRDYGSYLNLINAYNWKKQGGKIVALVEKGLQEFPNDDELQLEKASYFYKTKQYDLAMNNYKIYFELVEHPPFDILMNYGISTYFADQVQKALEIFNDMNRMNPNDPLVMYYQSLCYKKQKDFEKSEEYMQLAIEGSTPNYVAEMYHHLGQIYGQQRKFKESVEALEKAYELNPQKPEVLFEIATTYEEYNSNKTLALNYYRIYLKEVGEKGKNINYSLDRITKLKEDLFFEE